MDQDQGSEKFEEFPPSFEEMKENLGEDRRNMLTLLFNADNNAMNTSELRTRAGISPGSIGHHTRKLQRWELIEEIDREYAGRGSRAIVWQLTEHGKEFYSDGLEEDESALARSAELDALREEVAELQSDVATMQQAMVKIAVKAGGVKEETAENWLED